jgi:hypothetical protein
MKAQEIAAILGPVIASIGLIITLVIFMIQQRGLIRVQKRETYQRLELASNDVFRFTASHAAVLARYQTMKRDPSIDFAKTVADNTIADNYIYQTLNLFEMAARLRKDRFFEDEVFASWVIWYYELLTHWYFRDKWQEIEPNYTGEMRDVFDKAVRSFDSYDNDARRKREFFAHVARVLRCPDVERWLDRAGKA